MTGAPMRRRTLITLFSDAGRAMLDELVRRLAAHGYSEIRPAHSRVFENLDPEGTRLTVLAERAQLTHPSMSELVATLQQLGYLERVPDQGDRRARLVRLTAEGRALQRIALAEIAEIEEAWLRRLGPDAGPALREALHAFVSQPGVSAASRRAAGRPVGG